MIDVAEHLLDVRVQVGRGMNDGSACYEELVLCMVSQVIRKEGTSQHQNVGSIAPAGDNTDR